MLSFGCMVERQSEPLKGKPAARRGVGSTRLQSCEASPDQLPSPDGRVLQSFLIHCFIFSFLTTERWSVCHTWIPVRPAPGAASGKNLTSSLSFLWNKPKTISMWEHPGPRRSATWFKRNSFRFQSSEFWNCPLNANRFWTIVGYFYAWILTLPTS